jgi:hypothetical protein
VSNELSGPKTHARLLRPGARRGRREGRGAARTVRSCAPPARGAPACAGASAAPGVARHEPCSRAVGPPAARKRTRARRSAGDAAACGAADGASARAAAGERSIALAGTSFVTSLKLSPAAGVRRRRGRSRPRRSRAQHACASSAIALTACVRARRRRRRWR